MRLYIGTTSVNSGKPTEVCLAGFIVAFSKSLVSVSHRMFNKSLVSFSHIMFSKS